MKKLVLVITLILLTSCKQNIEQIPKGAILLFKEDNIEVFSDIHLKDLILDTNVKIEDYKIDTEVIGEKEIEFIYNYNNKKYTYKKKINIIDLESPKIFGGNVKTVFKGYKDNLCNLVLYGDNYDSEPLCFVDGEFDLDKVGSYKIKLFVQDSSGNITNHNITLNVVEKIESNENKNTSVKKLLFQDAYKKYKNDTNELGIDVSVWQGNIDFFKVKEAGASFAMIRIGFINKDKECEMDSFFKENIRKAKDAGLKVGIYFYSNALSSLDAIKEANWIIENLDEETLDLPIVFDWEIWNGWNSYHLSFHELRNMAKMFISTVEDSGYQGALYSSKSYLENFWQDDFDKVWLAHYTSNTNYTGDYFMWQFSNVGKINGINADVDMDILKLF